MDAAVSVPPQWAVFTHHGHVLIHVARNPDALVRDIANAVNVTERTVQTILKDLADAGYIERIHIGRRNRYRILRYSRLRYPVEEGTSIGELVDALSPRDEPEPGPTPHLAF